MADRKTRTRKPPRLDIPKIGFVREAAILHHYPISRSAWWAGVRSGRYPQPVKLSKRVTAWKASEIRELLGEEE